MLNTYYTEKITGLQDIEIKKIEETAEKIEIYMELNRRTHTCPNCGNETNRVHDYRNQSIRDVKCFGREVTLHLRKRRYVCSCGKRFHEENPWLARYQRETQRTTVAILQKCAAECSYVSIAREFGISLPTVLRRADLLGYSRPSQLPKVLGIDEFRGNCGGEKFQCILTDIENRKVKDILPTRFQNDLIDYFKKYDRSSVKYFVSDMYKPYEEIAKTYFPQAVYVIDKYHWIRQATWAFESVRKEVQKQFSKSHRIYFKHSRKLLLKRAEQLTEEQKQQVNVMLYASAKLSNAYFMKERLFRILDRAKEMECENTDSIKKAFREWVSDALHSEIQAFVRCGETYLRWLTPILNSFDCPYTNGFTEGCNNKIKVIKRNAYGVHKFSRFRNRILFSFS